jgi:hypothetical protein
MMVKSLGGRDPYDVMSRVARGRDQVVSNREAFDIIYPNHQAYYDDKKFIVFDRKFKETEEYLLNQFKQELDSQIDYKGNKNLSHASDYKKPDLSKMDLQNRAPFVHPAVVATDIKYEQRKPNDPNLKITASDPYKTIFNN